MGLEAVTASARSWPLRMYPRDEGGNGFGRERRVDHHDEGRAADTGNRSGVAQEIEF
jgi:hypothetical protein